MQLLLHPSDRPVFRLCGAAAQCHLEIRINDVTVLRDLSGQAHEFDLAINEWLFQGVNHVDILLSAGKKDAPFPARASFSARLRHKAARDTVRNITDIGEISWKPSPPHGHEHPNPAPTQAAAAHAEPETPEVPLLALPGQEENLQWVVQAAMEQPDKSVRISSALALPPPWPVCPWSRGSVLVAHDGTQRVITGELRKLHHTLKFGGWEEIFKIRRNAVQAAYYLCSDEVDPALGFPPLLNKPAWELQPLPAGSLTLELAGNGKLARLLDPATGETPVILLNESAGLSASIEAWWMFGQEWLLVR